MSAEPLGLIAGDGQLPGEIARAAARQGRRVVAIAFPEVTDPGFAEGVSEIAWLGPGEVGAAIAFLRQAGTREAAMAGKVPRSGLVRGSLRLDDRARALLRDLDDLRDGTVLAAIAGALAEDGITLRPQAELVPELLAPSGVFGGVNPTPEQSRDVSLGLPVARQLAGLEIGQTVVVQGGAVVAVEAAEGTDETILRAGRLGRPGLCIVKVARPEQDPRFDLPTIGPDTMEVAVRAGAGVVAVEAGRTIVLNREAVVARADAAGIALLGVSPAPADSDPVRGEPA